MQKKFGDLVSKEGTGFGDSKARICHILYSAFCGQGWNRNHKEQWLTAGSISLLREIKSH